MGLAAAVTIAHGMPAQAGKKEWAAVAGFVGGVLVANAAQGHRTYHREVVYHQPVQHVVYQPAQTVVIRHTQPAPRGYYEWRTERVWVPGCWVYEPCGYNSRRKVWQPGYYRTVQNRVWVSAGYASSCGW